MCTGRLCHLRLSQVLNFGLKHGLTAGAPRIRIHDLRQTHASVGLREGASNKAMAERLGHARTSTTLGVYTRVTA